MCTKLKHYIMKKLLPVITFLILSQSGIAQNPIALDDYVSTINGQVLVNVTLNDNDPDGGSIFLHTIIEHPSHGVAEIRPGNMINYNSNIKYAGGMDTLWYSIRDSDFPQGRDTAMLVMNVDDSHWFDSILVNNIHTGVNADGLLFSVQDTLNGFAGQYPYFEFPGGSGNQLVYAASFFFAGKDIVDTVVSAARDLYQNGVTDFWPGPVSDVYDTVFDRRFNRVWKVTQAEIDYHLTHWTQPGYLPSRPLLDWPGNGNVSLGQSAQLAPYVDVDYNGIYDPWMGDYPLIKGPESVLFIMNDDRYPHAATNGYNLRIEVVGLLYALQCPNDSALSNTVFLNCTITNRSVRRYVDFYLGIKTDADIADQYSDYVGSDVQRSTYYFYNSKNHDYISDSMGYGLHLPALACTFLAGPYMMQDGIDNPQYDIQHSIICDYGVNGLNFGDGTVDNERFGMTYFMADYICPDSVTSVSTVTPSYFFNQATSVNAFGPMRYGGRGMDVCGAYGPDCRFEFPGTTDTCGWGLYGNSPNGPVDWTEITAGNTLLDRRGIGSSGPMVLEAGAYNVFDFAFIVGRNYADTNVSGGISVMQQRIDSIRSYFQNDMIPCGGGFSGVKPQKSLDKTLKIYPNPTNGMLTLEFPSGKDSRYEIFDITGNLLRSDALNSAGIQQLDISSLRSGLYVIRVCTDGQCLHARFILQ